MIIKEKGEEFMLPQIITTRLCYERLTYPVAYFDYHPDVDWWR